MTTTCAFFPIKVSRERLIEMIVRFLNKKVTPTISYLKIFGTHIKEALS